MERMEVCAFRFRRCEAGADKTRVILLPAIASFLAVLAGRWQLASRSDPEFGSPGLVRLIVVVALVSSAASAGVAVYAGRDAGVTTGRALHGAVVAALATGLPLTGYYALAAWARPRLVVFGCWVLSLVPLYIYFLIVLFGVAGLTNCPPGVSDCPL